MGTTTEKLQAALESKEAVQTALEDHGVDVTEDFSTYGALIASELTNREVVESHVTNTNNPHNVTKSQVGLGNVPNVKTNDQTPTYTVASSLTKLSSGEKLSVAFGKIAKAISDLISHLANKSNPHGVTAAQVGAIPTSQKGAASGVAELDSNGKVPSSQLPAYVDDVLEYTAKSSFPSTGETGKIYVDTTTNKTYRWSGSAYVEISASLALGETSSTAYRGDRGKIAYEHSQKTSGNPHNVTKSDIGLGNVENKSSETIRGEMTKENVTDALGYTPPTTNTTYSAATQSKQGLMSAADKKKLDGIATGANAYTHPTYTEQTGEPTANQTPSFGGTFKVSQPISDETGHIIGMNTRTITIPNTVATQSVAGLLSAANKKQLDYGGVPIVTTAGTGAAYTATVDGMAVLKTGMRLTIIPHTASTAANATLNVNSLGAKYIRQPLNTNTSSTTAGASAGWIIANKPVTLMYNGTYWITESTTITDANNLYGTLPITKGGTGATTAEAALEKLGALGHADVVDNLLSESTDLPLSAYQGKVLKAYIDALFGTRSLSHPTDKFSDNQCLCKTAGNITHVYVSLKSATTITNGTTVELTGHPIVQITQEFSAVTFNGTSVKIQVTAEKIFFKLDKDFPTNSWLRFAFSYISTK